MTQSDPIPSDERIVNAMIQLARVAKSHRMIVTGSNSAEVFRQLHRRGYPRVTTTTICRVPHVQNDVALITWREHSIKALAATLDWFVHFLSPAGVLVVWVSPHERMSNQALRLALKKLGFRIEARTCCENGLEMRALFFSRDHCHLDVLESSRFEKLMQLHFAETQPVIGVKLAGALEAVAEQIQNYDPSALS